MERKVKILNIFNNLLDNIYATAKTCYSSKGIFYPVTDNLTEEYLIKRDNLLEDLLKAGHLTTYQHIHIQFAITGVSRHLVWTFLHSHPFYNSEQVSQRYVEVSPENFYIPPYLKDEPLNLYKSHIEFLMDSYEKLKDILLPHFEERYKKIFPHRDFKSKKWKNAVKRKALEISRYVLPLATLTYLYHTINLLTLFRYIKTSTNTDIPTETKELIKSMIDELLKVEPGFLKILRFLENYEELSTPPGFEFEGESQFSSEFDKSLGDKQSVLVTYLPNQEEILAQGVRAVLGLSKGQLSDELAIEYLLNPKFNHVLKDSLNLTYHHKLSQVMGHSYWLFKKKISHTCDSQNQRHRTSKASRPYFRISLTPDYIIPQFILEIEEAYRFYRDTMERIWENLGKMKSFGVPEEVLIYMLPNSYPIRIFESYDLLSLRHKVMLRLCYNAQEEIWKVTMEEVNQIREVSPSIGKWLLPPCGVRYLAQSPPYCPEGERFCGVLVWKLDPKEYKREL